MYSKEKDYYLVYTRNLEGIYCHEPFRHLLKSRCDAEYIPINWTITLYLGLKLPFYIDETYKIKRKVDIYRESINKWSEAINGI